MKLIEKARSLTSPKDFEANQLELNSLKDHHEESLLELLKMGCEIRQAVHIAKDVFKLSTETRLTTEEILLVLRWSMKWSALIDIKQYS